MPVRLLFLLALIGGCAHLPTDVSTEGLPNFQHVSDRVYSGGQPDGPGFANLANCGIRTVVSVDGAAPDVAAARAAGMRYIHIPISYDGVPSVARLSLAQVLATTEAPWYVHCHHGHHRAPAAAAILAMFAEEIQRDEALRVLARAGTSPDYLGLWEAVRASQPPAADASLPPLQESAPVPDLAGSMARIDRIFDRLKAAPLPQDALLLQEEFREAHRLLPADAPDTLRQGLLHSIKQSARLDSARKLDCRSCHNQFRD
jgi:protein tyrosine phosphatase (PTP) superfamily phosphohydrolase (DUF442 family)